MPVVHRFGPYEFYFYSDEGRARFEPAHVHVRSGDGAAAFWLEPVSLRDSHRYNRKETERIRRIVVANREHLLRRWHEYFGTKR